MTTAREFPPLALYVHIPWCVRKCPYCDFNSHAAGGTLPEDEYVAALAADLDAELEAAAGRPLQSIFFGGGTPSLFSGRAIGRILEAVHQRLPVAADAEITLEANPGTVEQRRFADFLSAGINRLSMGIQSFQPEHLAALGRIHSRDEAIASVEAARRAGFDNINLDLMHGLPAQTPAQAAADLRQATALEPEHLSWYQLTIEPNTEFYSRPPALPAEDTLAAIQEAGEALLDQAGFTRYEISAYSRPGRQSQHNRNYWEFGDFIGIGAGAHGKLSTAAGIYRNWKTRAPRDYLAARQGGRFRAGQREILATDLALEFMMNALRLVDGVPAALYEQRTGQQLAAVAAPIEQLRARGLVRPEPDRLAATAVGLRYLDSVLAEF